MITEILTDWYYVLIIMSIIIGLIGSYIHNNGSLLLFTIITAIILYYYQDYLRILINNYTAYENNSIIGYMLTVMSILWFLIYCVIHYNILVYGGVVE